MEFDFQSVRRWVASGYYSDFWSFEYVSDSRIIYLGDDQWFDAFSKYCPTVVFNADFDDMVLSMLLEACDAVFLIPSIDLRTNPLARLWAERPHKIETLVKQAKWRKIPVFGLCEDEDSYAVFRELFKLCDRVILANRDISFASGEAEIYETPALFCSRTFNPNFTTMQAEVINDISDIRVIAQDSHLFNASQCVRGLFSHLGKALTVFDYDYTSRIYRINKGLFDNNYIGLVDYQSYQALLKLARVQIFVDDGTLNRALLAKRIVENNACYSVSLVLTSTPEFFDRLGARTFESPFALLDELSLLMSLEEYWENVAHHGWRTVHSQYSLFNLLRRLDVVTNNITVSMITPTIRPENFKNILQNYKTQSYEEKELIVVINGGDSGEWRELHEAVAENDSITILALSSSTLSAGALNAGLVKARGDLCFRVDDDDAYGPSYASDVVLHYISIGADLMGKKMEYVFFSSDSSLYRRSFPRHPSFLIGRSPHRFHSIAGNSFVVKREFGIRCGFKVGTSGFADSEFLLHLDNLRPPPRLAYLDSRSLVMMRNASDEHTWSAGKDFFVRGAKRIGYGFLKILN